VMSGPMISSSLAQKIIRNTLFNFLGRFWALVVAFLLTPYIVSKLGLQAYGVWALVLVITSYLGLLDFGVGTAFVKYVAEHEARQDYVALNTFVSTGFAFYLAMSSVIIAFALVFGSVILRLLKIPPELMDSAWFVLVVAATILAFSNAFSVFQGVITGLQRLDVLNIITLVVSVPDIIGTILFLQLGYGLRGLIVNEVIVFILTTILLVTTAFRLLPGLQLRPVLCTFTSLRRLVSYGLKVQISQLADLASSQMNKLLIGYFLGLSSVSLYELGSKAVLTGKRLSLVMASAILPAASEIEARQDEETLRRLYIRGSKYLVLIAAPLMLFLLAGAPALIRTWLGPGYTASVLVIQFLSLGHLVHLLTGVGTAIAKGIGRPEYETQYTLLLLVLQTVLGITLIIKLGFFGILLATPTSLLLSSCYFMIIFHRYLRLPLRQFLYNVYLKPMGACFLASLAVLILDHTLARFYPAQGRLAALSILGLEGLLFLVIYLGLLWQGRYLDEYDRRLLPVHLWIQRLKLPR
jgi:O-antigen/teichoic acid export membrane protein